MILKGVLVQFTVTLGQNKCMTAFMQITVMCSRWQWLKWSCEAGGGGEGLT